MNNTLLLKLFLYAITACWLLAACAPASGPASLEHTEGGAGEVLAYDCECVDIVTILQGEMLHLSLFRDVYHLPHVPSGSGAKYSDGRVTFWTKGETAVLESPDDIYPNCRIDRQRSVWEAARLRGVTFRAIGQEPGWHLEIGGLNSLLVLDYGSRTLHFATPEPVHDGARTFYRTTVEQNPLTVLLEDAPCRDTMSGEDFPQTVTVTLGDRSYHGCGKSLNR